VTNLRTSAWEATLLANGYPKRFIIDSSKTKRSPQQSAAAAPEDAKSFCVQPYVKGTTEPIKWVLNSYNIKVALNTRRPLAAYFPSLKITFQNDQAGGVIYSILCKDCDPHRRDHTRLREHQKVVEQEYPKKSALAEHCLQSGHTI